MKQLLMTVLAFSALQLTVWAQHKTIYLKAADSYYKHEDYYSASLYYEKYLASGTQRNVNYSPYAGKGADIKYAGSEQQAVYQLADSYRRLNDPAKAAPYYQQVLDHYPLAAYYYGVSLRALGKYDSATILFDRFLATYTTHDTYRTAAEKELRNLRFIQAQLQQDTSTYHLMKSTLNGEGATYAPVWWQGTLLYTATPKNINRIYQDGKPLPIVASPAVHQGAVSAAAKGLYLTQWNVDNGKKSAAIYYSNLEGTPVKLDTLVNMPGTNSQQPFVHGSTLYFSSDRPGGYGGYDLWIATLDESGHPVTVKNAGPLINTADDEQAPYYYAPEQTLVFASNGFTGMGGFDLYYAKGDAAPVNFGYPVNDVKDDMYFMSKGKNLLDDVMFCSDRSAQCCLEMFTLHKDTLAVAVNPVKPVELPVNMPVPVNHIYYETNQYTVSEASYPALDSLAAMLAAHPDMEIEISAHTDNVGTASYNQELSEKRAQNLVAYLVQKGIAPSRLQSKGYGDTIPVASNDTPEGRQQNRRIELKILKQ